MRVVDVQLKKSGFYEAVLEEDLPTDATERGEAESRIRSLEAVRFLETYLQQQGHPQPLYGDLDMCYYTAGAEGKDCIRRKLTFRF